MTEDAIFKEQWSLLKKEMAMGDAHLQQRLEQFIFRQYGRAVLAHYIKALSALELSRHFYLRCRRRSRSVTEPILYWTVLSETTIHMTLEGVKDMHPFISLPACAGATFQLDMLKDCYLLYLRDREYPCWPRASAEDASSGINGTLRSWKPPISPGCAGTARTAIMPT